jgi:Fe2+ or Zn2+ uptake regulation protein
VLTLLRADRGHPTATQVHRRLVGRPPNVSQKTVYELLDALVDVGLARCVTESGGAARYEARPERHDHAYCRVCGRLFDIPARADETIRNRAEIPKDSGSTAFKSRSRVAAPAAQPIDLAPAGTAAPRAIAMRVDRGVEGRGRLS